MRRDDAELLARFESRTLPFDEWTHRAHVRIGFLYVRDHGYGEALSRMRRGIQAYNAAQAERVRTGYHETITVAFLRLITAAVELDEGCRDSEDFCDRNPSLLGIAALERHYTHARLWSEEAAGCYQPPDLEPLPARVGANPPDIDP